MFKRFPIILLSALALLSASCSDRRTFEVDGQLLNMNQGTLYVYSNTGLLSGVDTVNIVAGRFQYSRAIADKGTLVMVFPNLSEVPLFAEPGKSVKLKGNAQQLKAMTVSGTDDNDLMTSFRMDVVEASPPQALKTAERYINENAASPVAVWLLEKHFLNSAAPDRKKIAKLADIIGKAQPDNPRTGNLVARLKQMKTLKKGDTLPKFSAKDVNGKTIDNETLKGKKTVVFLTATWDYASEMDRNVRTLVNDKKCDFRTLKICVDAADNDPKRVSSYYAANADIRVVCDEKMFSSPLLATFGFCNLDDNVIIDENGKILEVNLPASSMADKLRK